MYISFSALFGRPHRRSRRCHRVKIGSEKRPGMVKKGHESLPGPIYEIPSKMIEGPKSSMHAIVDKVDQIKKKNVPGPGNYDLQNSPNTRHKKGPSFSLGTS